MKNLNKVKLAAIILTGLLATSLFAQNKPTPRFARVAKMQGTAQLLRSGEQDWEDVALNMLVSEGDKIETDSGSYLEVQFDNGINLKIDESTDVEFTDLGKDESNAEKTSIYITNGIARVNVPRYYSGAERLYVETPDCFASFEEESKGEIEVSLMQGTGVASNNQSKVVAYTGRAEVSGDNGQVSLFAGEYTSVLKGAAPSLPQKAEVPYDSFEEWCSAQEQGAPVVNSQHAPDVPNSGELDNYGRWVYVDNYGWCWRPRVHFGWRPYYYGEWEYNARFGWVWTSDESWGWVPYHYGRWAYVWPEGWVWIPGTVWGSAWVCWYEGPDDVYWCPMGYDGNPWFYGARYAFYLDGWTHMHRDDFRRGRYKHHHEGEGERGKPYRGNRQYATGNLPDNTNWKKEASIKPFTLAQQASIAPKTPEQAPKQALGQNPGQALRQNPKQTPEQAPEKRVVSGQGFRQTNRTAVTNHIRPAANQNAIGNRERTNIAPNQQATGSLGTNSPQNNAIRGSTHYNRSHSRKVVIESGNQTNSENSQNAPERNSGNVQNQQESSPRQDNGSSPDRGSYQRDGGTPSDGGNRPVGRPENSDGHRK